MDCIANSLVFVSGNIWTKIHGQSAGVARPNLYGFLQLCYGRLLFLHVLRGKPGQPATHIQLMYVPY